MARTQYRIVAQTAESDAADGRMIGILIAWVAAPRRPAAETSGAPKLRLVIAATMIDQALRRRPDGNAS